MKIIPGILLCSLSCGLVNLPAYAQKKNGQKLCKLIIDMETLIQQAKIDTAFAEAYISIDRFKAQVRIMEKLSSDLNYISKRADSITIRHFRRPKVYHALSNLKSTLSGLKIALNVQKSFISSLPNSANLHVKSDSISPNFETGKWEWNENFDLWITDVYKYNILPGLLNTSMMPVILEYEHFKYALFELKETLPDKWREKCN